MTPQQALKNLDQAVSQINTSREIHNVLLQSLKILEESIKTKE